MGKIVYVMSDNRSGSTLLDNLLGAHCEIISLGEVHHLVAYVLKDRSLYDPIHALKCSCGNSVDMCPFWASVIAGLGRTPESLKLRLRFFEKPDKSAGPQQFLGRLLRRSISRNPRLFRSQFVRQVFGAQQIATDSFNLYDTVLQETRAKYLVDSSKDAFRFRALYETSPDRILGVLLARDYRGTVYSKLKRGRDVRRSAIAWNTQMVQMKTMTCDIPREKLIRIRYEDLCNDARAELTRICDFLDIDFSESMLTRSSSRIHTLGGSPSKFDPARSAIVLDESYLDSFDESDLKMMRSIVEETAKEWGYY